MLSAFVFTSAGPDVPPLAEDLRTAGMRVVEANDCLNFMHSVIKAAPDLVVCFETSPEPSLFEAFGMLATTSPLPVIVFTTDQDAEKIALATRSGVHAYVVNGYSLNRLRSVAHLAQARFRHEQLLRQELADVNRRFAERKLVDRAKGILMGARQMREEEAFRALRSAAMASKQRIGQLSQIVIDAARFAEAMNRAGRLRMLSQRLVKLYALACADALGMGVGMPGDEAAALFRDSLEQTESNLAILGKTLSQPTFGDLLEAVLEPWGRLRTVLRAPPLASRLREVDGLAEALLERAEQLAGNLEVAAFAMPLRVINVAGRQRMLSQRLAKEALIGGLLPAPGHGTAGAAGGAVSPARLAFEQGLAELQAMPLSNAEIRQELGIVTTVWTRFAAALGQAATPAGAATPAEVREIAATSETLLGHCDRLTDMLERGMQALVG